jgi:biotin carboxyl carrier protein
LHLLIKEGDRVKTGQTVLRMEAMKMENDIVSPQDGIIRKIMVTKGAEVREGDILIEFGKS